MKKNIVTATLLVICFTVVTGCRNHEGKVVVFRVDVEDAGARRAQEVAEDHLIGGGIVAGQSRIVSSNTLEMAFGDAAAARAGYAVLRKHHEYEAAEMPTSNVVRIHLTQRFVEACRQDTLTQVKRTMLKRMEELGVGRRIRVLPPGNLVVTLPGVENLDRIIRLMKQTAKLELRLLANDKIMSRVIANIEQVRRIKDKLVTEGGTTEEGVRYESYKINDADTEVFHIALKDPDVQSCVPPIYELMLGRPLSEGGCGVFREFALVEREVVIDGTSLKDAKVTHSTSSDLMVTLSLDAHGGARLKHISREAHNRYKNEHIVSRLAIILDGVIYSSPLLLEHIPQSEAVIRGRFTEREAADLALVLRSGELPGKVYVVSQ